MGKFLHHPLNPAGLLLLLTLVGLANAQGLPLGDHERAGFDTGRLARIGHFVDKEIQAGRMPGAVTVIARDGKIVHRGVAGYQDVADGTPLSVDTIFRFYSMTKPVLGVATMILVEEGLLKLDDPVSKYIPGFDHLRVYVSGEGEDMVTEPLAHPILVHHLATHTAGFTSFGNTGLNRLLQAEYKGPDQFPSLEAFIAHLLTFPTLFQPGDDWKYSPSFGALGYVLEVAAEQPLKELLAERIFEPLGMTDTGFHVPADKVGRFASTYYATENGLELIETGSASYMLNPKITPRGGGGLVSTAADYLRFAQMVLNGGELDGVRLLAPTTVRMMTTNHLPPGLESYPGEGYGIGFGVDLDIARKGVIGNNGTFHWAGAARTHFWVDPKAGVIGLFLTQVQTFSFDYDKYMRNLTYQALVE